MKHSRVRALVVIVALTLTLFAQNPGKAQAATNSPLTLKAEVVSGGDFQAGTKVVVKYTATNTSTSAVSLPAGSGLEILNAHTDTSYDTGTMTGGCQLSGFGETGNAFIDGFSYALPPTMAAGASITCTLTYTAVAGDVANHGIFGQFGYVPAVGMSMLPGWSWYTATAAGVPSEPTVVGTPMTNKTLSIGAAYWGAWTDSYSYQWLRNGQPIAGATGKTYVVGVADIGAKISVAITGWWGTGSSITRTTAPTAAVTVDVYTTPGTWTVNGRQWRTSCEPYSQTQRCRTEIWASTVTWVNGKFVTGNGWVFNNLTYLPMTRAQWGANPLANTGTWTTNGRQWRSECLTAATGFGCRSYIYANVIVATRKSTGGYTYSWQWKWVLNNIVQFKK